MGCMIFLELVFLLYHINLVHTHTHLLHAHTSSYPPTPRSTIPATPTPQDPSRQLLHSQPPPPPPGPLPPAPSLLHHQPRHWNPLLLEIQLRIWHKSCATQSQAPPSKTECRHLALCQAMHSCAAGSHGQADGGAQGRGWEKVGWEIGREGQVGWG